MILDDEVLQDVSLDTEYAIYTRKSTEEASNKQVQSIPDQISACLKYARDNNLKLMKMPEKYRPFFETENEIIKEESDENLSNQELYKKTRDLFVIKEQETGKEPFKRKKWRKLIELIEAGKIKGLLSYSPDRQARNILEGGEIINFIDRGKIELKYTNFHFEPTASGKMMLGIWFVFSKQYSDKLQEDTNRGMKSAFYDCKALGYYKHGYRINEQDYHEPDPETFPLIRKAFEMKIYEGKRNTAIIEFLEKSGYKKTFKESGEKISISKNSIGQLWRDPFYGGTHVHGDCEVEISAKNPFYKPIITAKEVFLLAERLNGKSAETPEEKHEKHLEIKPFSNAMFYNAETDKTDFTVMVPNIKRFVEKVAEGKFASLEEAIDPSQIDIRCMVKDHPYYKYTIKATTLINEVARFFETINITEEDYQNYIEYAKARISMGSEEATQKTKSIRLQRNKIKHQKEEFVKANLGKKRDEDEQKIYEKERKRYDVLMEKLDRDLSEVDQSEKENIEEYETFINTLRDLATYYRKGTYVQKRKLAEIFISNIKISPTGLTIKPKPEMRDMFNCEWLPGADSNRRPIG